MPDHEMQRYLDHLAGLPDGPDGHPEPGEPGSPHIRIAVTPEPPGRLRRVHTNGLWWSGLPELFVDVPSGYQPGQNEDSAGLAFLLASGLIAMGQELTDAEDFDIPPHTDVFHGRPVKLWLAQHEAPDDDLLTALGTAVDTVIRVRCSLWSDPPGSSGPFNPPGSFGPPGLAAARPAGLLTS